MATKHLKIATALREKVRRQILGAMELAGVTQARLAERLDVSGASVSTMLSANNGGRNLELDTLQKVAAALGGEWQVVLVIDGKNLKMKEGK